MERKRNPTFDVVTDTSPIAYQILATRCLNYSKQIRVKYKSTLVENMSHYLTPLPASGLNEDMSFRALQTNGINIVNG